MNAVTPIDFSAAKVVQLKVGERRFEEPQEVNAKWVYPIALMTGTVITVAIGLMLYPTWADIMTLKILAG